ncbi:MAG TPA: hypothetical protein VMS92_06925 [Mycobacterium sp.]|nr:hypothetical protein [Mycobacterium sp.]
MTLVLILALLAACAWVSGPCEISNGLDGAAVRCQAGGRVLVMPASSIRALGDAAEQNTPRRGLGARTGGDLQWPDP